MLGYSLAELRGKETRVHYASEEDFAQLGRQAYAQIAGTGAFSAESRMPRKDGTLIWVQLDSTALNRDHPEEGTLWSYVDVTRRKQADAERLQLKPGLLNIARLYLVLVAVTGCNDATAHAISFDCPHNDPVQGPGQFDVILVDERLIRHILGNLLSNACKYAPANSEVLLRLVGEGHALVFEVSDTAIGFAPEDLLRLFESSYRSANVGNRPG